VRLNKGSCRSDVAIMGLQTMREQTAVASAFRLSWKMIVPILQIYIAGGDSDWYDH